MAPNDEPLEALRRQDSAALRALVEANAGRLYRAARAMGHAPDVADDLVQDVFVTCLSSLDRFEGRARVSTWLYGILVRKSQEQRRRHQRAARSCEPDERWEAQFDDAGRWARPPVDPERRLSTRELATAIATCLDALPPAQRDVFVLRQVDELRAHDVSTLLSLTTTHIGVLLHRARARLRECLGLKGWRTRPAPGAGQGK